MTDFIHAIGGRHVMYAILGVVTLLIARALRRRSSSALSKLNLDKLLLDDETGKISKGACVMFGSFALSTWCIVFLTVEGKLTESYFGAYLAAWVAPTVTKILKGTDAPPASTTTEK
jgi:hypothetical protein